MITKLKIKNFKSFSKIQEMKLAPITLIFGPNSSGKSTLIQSLMMLKQTVLAQTANGELITNGTSINLGNFNTLVHGQRTSTEMEFDIAYTLKQDASEFRHKYSYDMLFSNKDSRELGFNYSAPNGKGHLNKFSFGSTRTSNDGILFNFTRKQFSNGSPYYSLNNTDDLVLNLVKRWKIEKSDGKRRNELINSMNDLFVNATNLNLPVLTYEGQMTELYEYYNKINNDIQELFSCIKYLGPLRSSPKRFYSAETNQYSKGEGKNNLGIELYKAIGSVKGPINKYLRQFEIPYELDALNIGNINSGDVISIELTDLRNNTIVTPSDVGFGIGQVLPIILESLISKNKILCVEQPEIHLHPKLQAHLADLFIDSVTNNNQWIIETHSEALMLRIQRRIREGKLSKEDVSVLYVDAGDHGAQITPLHLDNDGDFTVHWPNGFFEERLNEQVGF